MMIVRSFKAKMALFSVCTSGLVFVAFALLLLKVNEQAAYERVDRQLHRFSEGPLRRLMMPYQGAPLAATMLPRTPSNVVEELKGPFAVCLIGREGRTVYLSSSWPAALTTALSQEELSPDRERMEGDRPMLAKDPQRQRGDVRRGPFGMRRGAGLGGRLQPPQLKTCLLKEGAWRVLSLRQQGVSAYVATDLSDVTNEIRVLRLNVALIGVAGLLLLAAGGWFLAVVALRPVKEVTRVAEQITSAALHERVHVYGASDEFQALVNVINLMLERLEKSFSQAQRFSADAAHELKTPLAILQGQLDYALRHAPADSPEQQLYLSLLDEVQRLKSIVNKLLVLAQSDAGKLALTKAPLSLATSVQTLCEDVPLLAPDVTLDCLCEEDVIIKADAALFRQVLQNLFSNAIKYNCEKGMIRCRVFKEGGQAVMTLMNTLAGEMQIEPDHLFERFYRGDPSHNRRQDGYGLGLSLAREIARAHGGDLTVESLTDDTITLRLTCPLTGQK